MINVRTIAFKRCTLSFTVATNHIFLFLLWKSLDCIPNNILCEPPALGAPLQPPVALAGAPEENVLVAKLLAEELGEGLEAGGVAQQLVKVGGPAPHPPDVFLLSAPLLLARRVLDDGLYGCGEGPM